MVTMTVEPIDSDWKYALYLLRDLENDPNHETAAEVFLFVERHLVTKHPAIPPALKAYYIVNSAPDTSSEKISEMARQFADIIRDIFDR